MSAAARSVFAFGVYLASGGLLLVFAPERVCRLLALRPPGGTFWMRLCGMFFLDLAYYCVRAARSENAMFIRWSTYTRPWTLVFLSAFAACGLVEPIVVTFGLVDVLATLWTVLELRRERMTTE